MKDDDMVADGSAGAIRMLWLAVRFGSRSTERCFRA